MTPPTDKTTIAPAAITLRYCYDASAFVRTGAALSNNLLVGSVL